PVDHHSGRIVVRSLVHQWDHRPAGLKPSAFLQGMSIEHIDGQSLPFSLIDIIGLGRDGNRKLARCQPVGLQPLARIPHQGEPANCEELFYIFRSELWIVIEKKQRASASWVPRILDCALSLPFSIEEIAARSDG